MKKLKKLFKTLAIALLVIPCLFLFTACGDKGGNGDKGENKLQTTQEEAYNVFKNLADNYSNKNSISKTYIIDTDSIIKSNCDSTGVELTEDQKLMVKANELDIKDYEREIISFNSEGEGIKYQSTKESEELDYKPKYVDVIKKINDKYVLLDYRRYEDDSVEPSVIVERINSAEYVGDDYARNVFGDIEGSFLDEVLTFSKDNNSIEDYKKALTKELEGLQELLSELTNDNVKIDLEKVTTNIKFSVDNSIYKLEFGYEIKDINYIDETEKPATAGLNANIILSFNNSRIMGVKIGVNINANGHIVLDQQENALILPISTNFSISLSYEESDTFDTETFNKKDWISYMAEDQLIENSTSILELTFDGYHMHEFTSLEFDTIIDHENLKQIASSIVQEMDENLELVELYLDKAHTQVLNATTLQKAKSYDMIIYAEIRAKEGFARVILNLFEVKNNMMNDEFYEYKAAPLNSEFDYSEFYNTYMTNYWVLDKVIVNGIVVDPVATNYKISIGNIYNAEYNIVISRDITL